MKQQETWYQVMGKTSGHITMESSGTADFPFPPGFRLCTLPALLCPKPSFFSATGGLPASPPLHSLFPLHGHCSLPQCHPPTPIHSLHLLFLPLGHSLPQCPPPFFTHCLPSVDIAPYPMSSHSPPYSASLIARICSPVSCSSSFNSTKRALSQGTPPPAPTLETSISFLLWCFPFLHHSSGAPPSIHVYFFNYSIKTLSH